MPVLQASPETATLGGLHLFHAPSSSCSQRVRLFLAERELAYVSHLVDLGRREQLSPFYRGVNPRGLVPAVVIDGERIVESIDIIEELDDRIPAEPAAVAIVPSQRELAEAGQRALKVLTHEFLFRARGAPSPEAIASYVALSGDPAAGRFQASFAAEDAEWRGLLDNALSAMRDAVARLNDRLGRVAWLAGDVHGLLDIVWTSTIHRLSGLGWPGDQFPAVADWHRRVQARPSFSKAVTAFETAAERDGSKIYVAARALRGDGLQDHLEALAA